MVAELRSALLSVLDDPLFLLGSCEMEGTKNLAKKSQRCLLNAAKVKNSKRLLLHWSAPWKELSRFQRILNATPPEERGYGGHFIISKDRIAIALELIVSRFGLTRQGSRIRASYSTHQPETT